MIDEQVSGGLQHVFIVSTVIIQFGILHFYRFVFHVSLGKLIKITVDAVFAIIALDFFLCKFKDIIEFQPWSFSFKVVQTLVDYAVVLIELQSAIGLLQEVTILCRTI